MDLKHSTRLVIFLSIQLAYTTLAAYTWEAEIITYCDTDHNGTIWKCNYIPQDIPDGFSRVDIEIEVDIDCDNTSFQSSNWQQVETLKLIFTNYTTDKDVFLHAYCFRNLRYLKYLGINIGSDFNLSPNAFAELNSVRELSLAECIRLEWNVLQEALNGSDKIPNLTDLDLSKVHIVYGPVKIDKQEADILGTRNLTRLNLSGMQVSLLNATALLPSLKYLLQLNVSSMNLNDFRFDGNPEELEHIKELDLSDMIMPKSAQAVGLQKFYNLHVRYDQVNHGFNKMLFIRKIIANSTFSRAIFEFYNCEFTLNALIPMKTETILVKDNNFKHIDINVSGDLKYRNTTIKHIDFSRNGMDFLHPGILSLFPNLISLRISENSLYKMLNTEIKLFEKLFFSNVKLKTIDLSTNKLELIPTHQFIYNVDLEDIILSNNLLQQVHWEMDNLIKLKILDLSNNRISTLDSISLNNLNSLISGLPTKDQLVLKIENNPISCSECESKPFITWLTKTSIVHLSSQKLTCTQENGKQGGIEKSQVQRLESICNRNTIIIACSATLGTAFIGAVSLSFILARRRKMLRQRLKRNQLLANIQQGEGEFEFVTMLSYNNQEEDFIRQYVLDPLNRTLQTMTDVDRELVLTGDQHFRPGFMVHNEIASSLERVSLVLLLITEEFCTSGYCLSELDQAWIQRKPMIFMFKEEVDENLMTPIMKTIYKKNVRILWTMEEGEYVLKTSWENVCQAILELIIN